MKRTFAKIGVVVIFTLFALSIGYSIMNRESLIAHMLMIIGVASGFCAGLLIKYIRSKPIDPHPEHTMD